MRVKTLLFLAFSALLFSCTTLRKERKPGNQPEISPIAGKYSGIVSHDYRKKGCFSIIYLNKENTVLPMIIIPIEALPLEFDEDGAEIRFDYHPLKMMQPEACPKGIPAEVSNISKNN
ncbi:MAG: hypothetical protein AB9842_06600 [Bacteroidales bacterium]